MEYVIHRWLGHDPRFRPNPFAAEHVRHHGQGDFRDRIYEVKRRKVTQRAK